MRQPEYSLVFVCWFICLFLLALWCWQTARHLIIIGPGIWFLPIIDIVQQAGVRVDWVLTREDLRDVFRYQGFAIPRLVNLQAASPLPDWVNDLVHVLDIKEVRRGTLLDLKLENFVRRLQIFEVPNYPHVLQHYPQLSSETLCLVGDISPDILQKAGLISPGSSPGWGTLRSRLPANPEYIFSITCSSPSGEQLHFISQQTGLNVEILVKLREREGEWEIEEDELNYLRQFEACLDPEDRSEPTLAEIQGGYKTVIPEIICPAILSESTLHVAHALFHRAWNRLISRL